jgi:small subunit ribosomal protein S3Ae
VFSVSLSDLLQNAKESNWRKIKLQIEDVKGDEAYTNFYGMDITRDKIYSVLKKWQSTIESFVDVKTQDGYFIRIFAVGFTQKRKTQMKATCYATSGQKKQIRGKMMEIMTQAASKSTLKQLAVQFLEKSIEKKIAKECNKIFPLQNIYVTKVKMVKKPKFDISRLLDMYSEKQDNSKKVAAPVEGEPQNTVDAPAA